MHFDPPPFPRGKLTIFDTLKIDFADLPRDVHFWEGVGGVGGYPLLYGIPSIDFPNDNMVTTYAFML